MSEQELIIDAEKAEALSPIFAIDGTTATKDAVKLYLVVLKQFTPSDVRIAVQNFIYGLVEGYDGRFRPTAPQLASECRRIAKEYKIETTRKPKAITQQKTRDKKGNVVLPPVFEEYKNNLELQETEKFKKWAEREEARMKKVNAYWNPPYGKLAIEALKRKDQEVE